MADYIEVAPGLVVDTDGEIVTAAGIDDPLKFIVARRDEARRQMKRWEELTADLDRVILRKQSDKTVAYGGIVATVRGGTYRKTDTPMFANAVAGAYAQAFDWEHSEIVDEVLGIIAAASGFRKDDLPLAAQALYDQHTEVLEKRPWVETAIAREAAPKRVVVPQEAAE